jgi:hypothetical protein
MTTRQGFVRGRVGRCPAALQSNRARLGRVPKKKPRPRQGAGLQALHERSISRISSAVRSNQPATGSIFVPAGEGYSAVATPKKKRLRGAVQDKGDKMAPSSNLVRCRTVMGSLPIKGSPVRNRKPRLHPPEPRAGASLMTPALDNPAEFSSLVISHAPCAGEKTGLSDTGILVAPKVECEQPRISAWLSVSRNRPLG